MPETLMLRPAVLDDFSRLTIELPLHLRQEKALRRDEYSRLWARDSTEGTAVGVDRRAAGCSKVSASNIRRGTRTPYVPTWPALAGLSKLGGRIRHLESRSPRRPDELPVDVQQPP